MVIQVDSYLPSDDVELLTFQGPNKNGYDMTSTHRPVKIVSFKGKYTGSDVASQFAMAGLRGSADIQYGTGEHWIGNIIVLKSGGSMLEGTKSGTLEITVRFYGAVTVTSNAAGQSGI